MGPIWTDHKECFHDITNYCDQSLAYGEKTKYKKVVLSYQILKNVEQIYVFFLLLCFAE